MNILETEDLDRLEWDSAKRVHASAEAMRIAYADALAYTADPEVISNTSYRLQTICRGRPSLVLKSSHVWRGV